jgi:carbohydrate-binding DOMON domain-containing protein
MPKWNLPLSKNSSKHLEEIITGIRRQLNTIFEKSDQSIYIYLDDIHKVCNARFASLLGYSSPDEWANVQENFPDAFVSRESQRTLVGAYQNAVQNFVGSTNSVTWKTKTGKPVKTTTILVPIIFEGHGMALHFIS